MRERDIELIASLAEGSLEDDSEARALIASSEEARAEYEAQRLAVETLRGAHPEVMSDVERATLRRDIWTGLRSGSTSTRQSHPWFYRWTVAAASLLVVVGSVAVLSRLGALGGDDSAETITQVTDRAMTAAGDEAGERDEAAGGSEEPTAAPESSDNAAGGADGAVAEQYLGGLTVEDVAFFTDEAALVRDGDLTNLDQAGVSTKSAETAACLDESGLRDYEALGEITIARQVGVLEPGATLVVAVSQGNDVANSPVVFVDTPTCVVAYVDEPG